MKSLFILASTSVLSFVIFKVVNKKKLDKQFNELLKKINEDYRGEVVNEDFEKTVEISSETSSELSSLKSSITTDSLKFQFIEHY